MKEKSTIVRHSLSQVRAMREQGQDQTSPDALEAESLGADFLKNARVVMPGGKTSVHLRLDSDVVEWFKANGKRHLTRIGGIVARSGSHEAELFDRRLRHIFAQIFTPHTAQRIVFCAE